MDPERLGFQSELSAREWRSPVKLWASWSPSCTTCRLSSSGALCSRAGSPPRSTSTCGASCPARDSSVRCQLRGTGWLRVAGKENGRWRVWPEMGDKGEPTDQAGRSTLLLVWRVSGGARKPAAVGRALGDLVLDRPVRHVLCGSREMQWGLWQAEKSLSEFCVPNPQIVRLREERKGRAGGRAGGEISSCRRTQFSSMWLVARN